jgi:hypothetical protein
VKAMVEIITKALLFSKITETKFRVSDNEVRMRNTFPTMSEENAMAPAAQSL